MSLFTATGRCMDRLMDRPTAEHRVDYSNILLFPMKVQIEEFI